MTDIPVLPIYPEQQLSILSTKELIATVIKDVDRVPRNVIDECAKRGTEMTQYLSNLHADGSLWKAAEAAEDGEWWLRHHAVMILGLIPSELAGLLLVQLMRRMSVEKDENLQDWLSGYWPALFQNKPDSVQSALFELCEDQSLDWYVRVNAIDPVIACAERRSGAALEETLARFADMAKDEKEDFDLRLSVCDTLLDFPREQYRNLLEEMVTRQSDWVTHFDEDDVQNAYAGFSREKQQEHFKNPWDFYEMDAITQRQIRWQEEELEEQKITYEEEDYLAAIYDLKPESHKEFHEPHIIPQAKIGRNEPCPCGSGKKYKQCCLKTHQVQPEDDFLWRRIRRAIEGLPAELLKFSDSHFGQEALLEAWDEFMAVLDDEYAEPFAPHSPHMTIFMPWFFYDWIPQPLETSVKHEALDGHTLARAYLHKQGKHLTKLVVRYLEECCKAPFSFYDVLLVRPNEGFVLRDIMTGEETNVTEQAGSHHTQVGDIMFAKLANIDQVTLLEACAPVMFSPLEKSAILDLRKEILNRNLPLTPELLKDYDFEMLAIYHDITDRLLNPAIPILQNTDGEPMLFHKLIYSLECSPREIIDSLKQIVLDEGNQYILTGGDFDPTDEPSKVELVWQKSANQKYQNWDNTILGNLRIEGATLAAEFNSESRALQFKAIMAKLSPGKSSYKTTVIESPQAMLTRAEKEGDSTKTKQRQTELDELNSQPAAQALIAQFMRQHYRDWPNQKLPILNGQTAFQAVKTPDGKEMVEAVLMDIERRSKHTTPPLDPAIIAELRERLGL